LAGAPVKLCLHNLDGVGYHFIWARTTMDLGGGLHMLTLGLSGYFHDSAACLVEDGKILAACPEDRFTYLKHDSSFPLFAAEFCLNAARRNPSELDCVAFYEEPHVKFTRVLTALLADFPQTLPHFLSSLPRWLSEQLWLKNRIARLLSIDPGRVAFVPHHISHAAQAFLASPFERAAILTLDGVGEWTCGMIGIGDRAQQFPITTLVESRYPASLGLLYAATTDYLGFRPNDQECSTMALAGFGCPSKLDALRETVTVLGDGRVHILSDTLQLLREKESAFGTKFRNRLDVPPRDPSEKLGFSCFDGGTKGPSDREAQWADLASSVQRRIEEIVLELARKAKNHTDCDALCLAGGVAMNAVMIGRLIESGLFSSVFVPLDPGDAGASVGAALLVDHSRRKSGAGIPSISGPYLGPEIESKEINTLLSGLMKQCENCFAGKIEWTESTTQEELIEDVVGLLAEGKVVGWAQGRAEFGPRALGNRSILADPSRTSVSERLSQKIKHREAFRPYALSVAEEDAQRLFNLPAVIPQPARWMQTVFSVRPEEQQRVRAAIHIDGTTRPQICSLADNPRFHALLLAWGRKSGLAALLNTSLNLSGLPLSATIEDAIVVFMRSDMDALAVNNTIIRRVR